MNGECECRSCRPEKVILIYAGSIAQANEYIRNNIKIIVSDYQLRGYSKDKAVLVTLPQENVLKAAKSRGIEIIEA